jgi:hypothetical protein
MNNTTPLDNPVWHSLRQTHRRFAIERDNILFYHPDYCPFGGLINQEGIAAKLEEYAALVPGFYIVGERPAASGSLRLNKELVCNQMVAAEQRAGLQSNGAGKAHCSGEQYYDSTAKTRKQTGPV